MREWQLVNLAGNRNVKGISCSEELVMKLKYLEISSKSSGVYLVEIRKERTRSVSCDVINVNWIPPSSAGFEVSRNLARLS